MGEAPRTITLSDQVSQAAFGELVGITQQAVSDLVGRGVIEDGETVGEWLLAYTKHLREQAAGRGADGELARERARLAREQADRVAMENARERKEVLPISVLEVVLGKVAGDVASILNGVVPRIKRRVPELSQDAVRIMQEELAKVRTRAAAVSLADAEASDGDEEDAD